MNEKEITEERINEVAKKICMLLQVECVDDNDKLDLALMTCATGKALDIILEANEQNVPGSCKIIAKATYEMLKQPLD